MCSHGFKEHEGILVLKCGETAGGQNAGLRNRRVCAGAQDAAEGALLDSREGWAICEVALGQPTIQRGKINLILPYRTKHKTQMD